jgi:hypothetical protein
VHIRGSLVCAQNVKAFSKPSSVSAWWALASINIAARSYNQERETLRRCDQLPKGPIHLTSKDCPVGVFLFLVAVISTSAEPKAATLPTGRDTSSLLHSRSARVPRTHTLFAHIGSYRVQFQIQISRRLVCSRDPPCMWPCIHHSSHILAQIDRRAIERLGCDSPGADHVRGHPRRHTTLLASAYPNWFARHTKYYVHVHSNETTWMGSHTHAHIKLTGCREPCRIPRQSAHPARHPHSPTPPLRQLM